MRNRHLYREVSKRILDLIGSSNLPTGGRLPSARSLATEFGVSYAVVRQALIALEAQGLLEVKDGSGTYVCDKFKFSAYGSPEFGSFDLIEALALVQAEAAAVAAPIISQQSLFELETFDANRQGMTDVQADSAFHNLVVRSTNNDVLILMVESLWEIQNSELKLRNAYLGVFESNDGCLKTARSTILRALKCRDAKGARLAMRAYFDCIMEALLSASEERAYQEVKSKTSRTRSRFLLSAQLG